jgi:voltage-gated potassium channel
MVKHLGKCGPQELAERKYDLLLIGTVGLFFVGPLYLRTGLKFPLLGFLFFAIVQLALKATIKNKTRLLHYRMIVLAGLICVISSQHVSVRLGDSLYIVGRSIYIVFLILTIRLFMGSIISAERITTGEVKGAVCLYLLAGVTWAFAYEVVYRLDPAAFRIDTADPLAFLSYSYSTLTSLGLGDITPADDLAISLTCLEAIAGQMFLAIFIARLIGLHILQGRTNIESGEE